jgi:hypothetical protein
MAAAEVPGDAEDEDMKGLSSARAAFPAPRGEDVARRRGVAGLGMRAECPWRRLDVCRRVVSMKSVVIN